MKNITHFSLGILIFILSTCHSVRAIEIGGETFCQLTIRESEQTTYKIIVPRNRVDLFYKALNVIGINCRNQKKTGYQNALISREIRETIVESQVSRLPR